MSKDPRVSNAISHWGARFITNGVPYQDFVEVTNGVETWDEWCEAWSKRGEFHQSLGEKATGDGFSLTAAQHFSTAAVCYHFGKFLFVHDLDQMRRAHMHAVACYTKALPYLDPPGERVEIDFDGVKLAGILRKPRAVERPPLVLMLMGLDSAKEEMPSYEAPFLARGLATLSIEGPGQGEAEYELALRPDFEVPMGKVLDWLEARNDIDARRIGLWGVSFGGYHAPRVAAFDERIKACVSLSGPFNFGEAWHSFPELSRLAFQVRAKAENSKDAETIAQTFNLEPVAGNITCPIYIVTGGLDRVTPPKEAQRLADAVSGPVILDVIDDASHVANNRAYRYRPQTADWLAGLL